MPDGRGKKRRREDKAAEKELLEERKGKMRRRRKMRGCEGQIIVLQTLKGKEV